MKTFWVLTIAWFVSLPASYFLGKPYGDIAWSCATMAYAAYNIRRMQMQHDALVARFVMKRIAGDDEKGGVGGFTAAASAASSYAALNHSSLSAKVYAAEMAKKIADANALMKMMATAAKDEEKKMDDEFLRITGMSGEEIKKWLER